jgi:hypothetical protein
MEFLGGELVMRVRRIGGTAAPLGPNAILESDGVVLYATNGAIMGFDGSTLTQIPCPIARTVFAELDLTNARACVQLGRIKEFDEWLMFYRTQTTSNDVDKCLIWHRKEGNVWSTSTLDRSGWTDATVGPQPVGVTPDGKIYEHEVGTSAAGQPLLTSLRTGDVALPDGSIYTVSNIIPDFVLEGNDNLSLSMLTRIAPLGEQTTSGPHVITPSTAIVNTRATGRFVAFELSSSSSNAFYRLGSQRIEIEQSGAQR